MGLRLPPESVLLGFGLVLRGDISQKELAAKLRTSPKQVSAYLQGKVGRMDLEQVVEPLELGEARTRILGHCIESLAELDEGYFSAEELAWVEGQVAQDAKALRRHYKLILRGGSGGTGTLRADRKAQIADADECLSRIQELGSEGRISVVESIAEYQTWAFVVVCSEHSEHLATKNLEEALRVAELACVAAKCMQGDEGFRRAVQGYAQAHYGNVTRVMGAHARSQAQFRRAWRFWRSGDDPERLLDPGRILELEASLMRDLRRPHEALRRLRRAERVSLRPVNISLKKASAYNVLGQHDLALSILLDEATPRWEKEGGLQLKKALRFNLAATYCHLGRFREAAELYGEVCELAASLGDEIDLVRVGWLGGRIAAGLGRQSEAINYFEVAAHAFIEREMHYDAALAVLEMTALLLEMGRQREVIGLVPGLVAVFDGCGVAREAIMALKLLSEALEAQTATPARVRATLEFLFRVQFDDSVQTLGVPCREQ